MIGKWWSNMLPWQIVTSKNYQFLLPLRCIFGRSNKYSTHAVGKELLLDCAIRTDHWKANPALLITNNCSFRRHSNQTNWKQQPTTWGYSTELISAAITFYYTWERSLEYRSVWKCWVMTEIECWVKMQPLWQWVHTKVGEAGGWFKVQLQLG